jgi:hypothetical protein
VTGLLRQTRPRNEHEREVERRRLTEHITRFKWQAADTDGCRALWAEVLSQAVSELRGNLVGSDLAMGRPEQRVERIRDSQRANAGWLWDDSAWVGSAVWICELLGLDIDVVRERVRR